MSTRQGLISNNMFVYCLNCPILLGDFDGYDAVVLFKESGVGHIGFLVQDSDGAWWHFYWGADGAFSVALSLFGIDVPEIMWCKKYTGNPFSLEEINNSGQYGGTYVNGYHLSGDFSNVINEIDNLSGDYNLYNNNCGQVVMRLLATADTSYREMLSEAEQLWTPAEINAYLSMHINDYHPIRVKQQNCYQVALN